MTAGVPLTLPTSEERLVALRALRTGNYELAEAYYQRILDWNLQAAGGNFDPKKFEADHTFPSKIGNTAAGHSLRKNIISDAAAGSNRAQEGFLRTAADAAAELAALAEVQQNYAAAVTYFAQAHALAPSNREYDQKLLKAERLLAETKK